MTNMSLIGCFCWDDCLVASLGLYVQRRGGVVYIEVKTSLSVQCESGVVTATALKAKKHKKSTQLIS